MCTSSATDVPGLSLEKGPQSDRSPTSESRISTKGPIRQSLPILVLDDALQAAVWPSNDAPVRASGVVDGGERGRASTSEMGLDDAAHGLGPDQRRVPVEDQDGAAPPELLGRNLREGVAGPELL